MKSLWQRLLGVLKRLSTWLEQRGSRPEIQTPQNLPEQGKEPQVRTQRLVPGQVGIYVHCSSCGMLHELDAVCHICGAPLCWDTSDCRITRRESDLDQMAVYCPTCAERQGVINSLPSATV